MLLTTEQFRETLDDIIIAENRSDILTAREKLISHNKELWELYKSLSRVSHYFTP